MNIRPAASADFAGIWPIFEPVVRAGETYSYPRDCGAAEARRLWLEQPQETWVAEAGREIRGTYFIKANQMGGGAHVCNCGYMVAPEARGRGLAAAMCAHSQARAVALGYKAMQFNFVISTNTGAIRLWRRLGFAEVGCLPRAFDHPKAGLVDALVMYKWLGADSPA